MDRLRRSLTLLAQAVARGRGLAHKSQLSRAAQHGTEHENCYQRARSKVLPMCPVAEPRTGHVSPTPSACHLRSEFAMKKARRTTMPDALLALSLRKR